MKKYTWLVAILFAACAEQNQEPKTAGYFIQDEEQSYMIGSDETTDLIKKWANAHNERDMESILSMEKSDIKIDLPDGTVINGKDEHSKVLESFFANNVTWKPYWILPYTAVKGQKTWVIAGFALTSNVDGEENEVLHMGDIQLEDGLVSRIIVYENQRPKKE
jgi:ketosteroid isomerase-like protein